MSKQLTPAEVRDRAIKAHLTLEALFDMAKLTRSTFWRWEQGKGTPQPLTLQKLSDALDRAEALRRQAA